MKKVALRRWTRATLLFLISNFRAHSMNLYFRHVRHVCSLNGSINFLEFQIRTCSVSSHRQTCSTASLHDSRSFRNKWLRSGGSSAMHASAQGDSTVPTFCLPSASRLLTVMDKVLPVGRCVGITLPSVLTTEALRIASEELMPEEVSYCLGLPQALQPGFLGGRLAIRRALVGMEEASSVPSAILHDQDGAPLLPHDVAASISHKRHMAVALVQTGCHGHIGVDIELPAVRRRVDLRRRVLTFRECDSLGGIDGVSEEDEVLLRFSMKEAVYKAVHPLLRRPLGFKEVEVHPKTGGDCAVHTSEAGAWGDLKLSAGWIHLPDVLGQPLIMTYCEAIDEVSVGERQGR